MAARQAIARLDTGDLDLVVTAELPGAPSTADARCRRSDLLDDVMDVALPPGHALAGEPSLAELAGRRGWGQQRASPAGTSWPGRALSPVTRPTCATTAPGGRR